MRYFHTYNNTTITVLSPPPQLPHWFVCIHFVYVFCFPVLLIRFDLFICMNLWAAFFCNIHITRYRYIIEEKIKMKFLIIHLSELKWCIVNVMRCNAFLNCNYNFILFSLHFHKLTTFPIVNVKSCVKDLAESAPFPIKILIQSFEFQDPPMDISTK